MGSPARTVTAVAGLSLQMLAKAQYENYKIDITLMKDLIETLETGSLCALGGGLPLPIKNAMKYFESELAPFFNS